MPTPKRAASDTQQEDPKKKKLASPLPQRIWREEDELSLLKNLVDFRSNKTKLGAKIDWDAFYNFVQGYFHGKFSMEQMLSKVKKLKEKFLEDKKRIDGRNDPHFTRCSDSAIFGYAIMLWGQDDPAFSNDRDIDDYAQQSEIVSEEETLKEDNVEVRNAETVNNNEAEKSNVDDKVGENKSYKTVGEDSCEDEDDDADVLCSVRDAFETMMSHGLSDYQKKLQLQKLINLGAGKRKELSKEWKALVEEETKLYVKKIKFSVKLAEALTD